MGSAGYSNTSAAMPSQMTGSGGQGLIQTPGRQANPLPRMSSDFGSQLGPSAPFLPAPLDPVFDDSGRALPRIWEYPVAWNLDLNQRSTPWTVLRSMADQIDIIHRCIEIRVAELTKLTWTFTIEDSTVTAIMAEENCSHAKAARIARDKYDEDIARLRDFWENPYPALGRSFSEWLTEFLWQHFVFDGTPVYPRYNLGKQVIGFEIVDAPTIKVLLDNRGAIPSPPSPAFQQVLWGFPRGEYQATPDSDGEFFNAPGKNNEYLRDQLAYFVRNRRTWSPYGFSAVEESIPAATLYLERQRWMKSEYQDGATPMAFFETDSDEMDHLRLASFERVFNDKMVGSTQERHRMKVLPRGFKPVFAPTIDERFKTDYDNFLILRIATVFGVAPSTLGIIPRSGLGGAGEREGEATQALTVSQKPLEAFIIETINTLSRRFLGTDKNITFAFDEGDDNPKALEAKYKAYDIALKGGQMTQNDVRGELGMPLFDMPEADEPFIVAGNSITFLRGQLEVDNSGETLGEKEDANASSEAQAQVGQAPQGAEGEVSEVSSPSEEQDSLEEKSVSIDALIESELEAFSKFVKARAKKGGAYRDFTFKTISEDDAYALNQDAQAILKGDTYTPPKGVQSAAKRALEWIADGKAGSGFTSVGRKRASDLARGAGVSMTTVRRMKAYFDRHQGDKDATGFKAGEEGYPSPGRVAWDAWGGDAGYSWARGIAGSEEKSEISDNPKATSGIVTKRAVHELPGQAQKERIENYYVDLIAEAYAKSFTGIEEAIAQATSSTKSPEADKSAARIAVAQNVKFDETPLKTVLESVYMDSGYVGTALAIKELGAKASIAGELAQGAVNFDWNTWEPGSPLAASLLDRGALKDTLQELKVGIRKIGKTGVDRIAETIKQGLTNGDPAKVIASSIKDVVESKSKAMTIAVTETNRAYNTAAVDQYQAAGLTEFTWLIYEGACDYCQAMDETNPHQIGDDVPPGHPGCRCTVLGVVS